MAKRSKKSEISKQAVNHTIGKAITKYRKTAELSQESLAERLDLGNEAVSRIERGLVIPTVERLIQMAVLIAQYLNYLLKLVIDPLMRPYTYRHFCLL